VRPVPRPFLALAATAMLFTCSICTGSVVAFYENNSKVIATADVAQADTMKIRLKVGDQAIMATLIDSETTRDFVSLLPLTLDMNDLFGREKFGHLPRAISEGGNRTRTYQIGDVIYWSPGPDVAIYYRHDGRRFPRPASSSWARSIQGLKHSTCRVPSESRSSLSNDDEDSKTCGVDAWAACIGGTDATHTRIHS
jgi:hypothetical protein